VGLAAVEPATVVKRLIPWLALGATALTVHTAWNLRHLRRPAQAKDEVTENVAVLIPARDEEQHIGATIESVRGQERVAHLDIHVLDDGSQDSTAIIAKSIADQDARVHVHEEADVAPPPGWLGKNYACARLSNAVDADVLVFLDADVHLEPLAIASLVHELRSGGFDLVAPYPRQEAFGLLERLVQPLLVWSWATTVPLRVAEDRQWASMSVANGQLMVFDASAYRSIGGHASVRDDVIEDVALMRRVREAGLRAITVDGSEVATCRMYESASDLIDGYTKSAWRAFGGPIGSIAVNSLLMALYVVPALAAVFGRGSTRAWGALGYAAGVTGRLLVARSTGERGLPDALAHPASIIAFVVINKLSWWRHLTGTTQWKGRSV
jgi:glycosyltransferase involved in cell wall biosynthesis